VHQTHRVRQVEQEDEVALGPHRYAAAMAPVVRQEHGIRRLQSLRLRCRLDRYGAQSSHAQNKKYRCAIGSTSAGAQVNSSPSAVTS
jgi:hypothetical protein